MVELIKCDEENCHHEVNIFEKCLLLLNDCYMIADFISFIGYRWSVVIFMMMFPFNFTRSLVICTGRNNNQINRLIQCILPLGLPFPSIQGLFDILPLLKVFIMADSFGFSSAAFFCIISECRHSNAATLVDLRFGESWAVGVVPSDLGKLPFSISFWSGLHRFDKSNKF